MKQLIRNKKSTNFYLFLLTFLYFAQVFLPEKLVAVPESVISELNFVNTFQTDIK